jgi:hypothetical protein
LKTFTAILLFFVLLTSIAEAQTEGVRWKRERAASKKIELLHSPQAINFATTTTLRKGEFEYEISHRFIPAISTEKAFLGIDGPANIRMALGYGISEKLFVILGRSSLQDNLDLQFKYRFFEMGHDMFPAAVAVNGGIAWNTQIIEALAPGRDTTDPKNFQYYGQLILNTLIGKKLGLGFVPSYLYNSNIYCEDTKYSFTAGTYAQYYIGTMLSVLLEGNTTITGFRGRYNSFHFGIELETGGHFFKIFAGNNASMNPGQYLAGSDRITSMNNLRLGFAITRILTL